MGIMLSPLIAFGLYLLLVGILSSAGRQMSPSGPASELKSSTYASGEAAPSRPALMGYQDFSLAALFFGILHMGVLILATAAAGTQTPLFGFYLLGLAVTLSLLVAH